MELALIIFGISYLIIFSIMRDKHQKSKDIKMVKSEWNKDPYRQEMVQFIRYLSLKEKT